MSDIYKELSTAMKIVLSNYSSIIDVMKKFKPHESIISNPLSNTSLYKSDEVFNTVINNNALSQLSIEVHRNNVVLHYKNNHYFINDKGISITSSWLVQNEVDISDIEDAADMFTLSTVRDFKGLSYDDIKNAKEISCNLIPLCTELRKKF